MHENQVAQNMDNETGTVRYCECGRFCRHKGFQEFGVIVYGSLPFEPRFIESPPPKKSFQKNSASHRSLKGKPV